MRARRVSVVLFSGLVTTACGAAGVRVAHPAATGGLVAVEDTYIHRTESYVARLTSADPAAWTDTARLVRLDAEAVCFDVVTRLVQGAGSSGGRSEVELDPRTATLEHDAGTLGDPTITPRPVGASGAVVDASTDYMGADGLVHTDHEAASVDNLTGGGIVCFAHRGAVAVGNHGLRLTYRQLDFSPTFEFDVRADPMPTSWPAGPIVAPGYEYLAR